MIRADLIKAAIESPWVRFAPTWVRFSPTLVTNELNDFVASDGSRMRAILQCGDIKKGLVEAVLTHSPPLPDLESECKRYWKAQYKELFRLAAQDLRRRLS